MAKLTLPERRVDKIFQQIDKDPKIKAKPDAIFLANGTEPHMDYSFFYVTGFTNGLFEGSALVAKRSGQVSVFTSPLEEEIARASGGNIELYTEYKKVKENLKVVGKNLKTVGISYQDLTLSSFKVLKSTLKGVKFVDIGSALGLKKPRVCFSLLRF